jgi:predicted PurR-regulated permease PerM
MLQRGPLIFLAVILAALLPFLLQIAWPFLTAFILASILAIVMNPIKNWLTVRIHRPGVATFLTTSTTVFSTGNNSHVCGIRYLPGTEDRLRCAEPAFP